ncbi:MAG: hypothetical protein BWZ10_03352 [candidate division BRC1 bacterium ADurb.BinA364]|nr:MAG: hypothetical protein BWZ10_03352 [candidate division BRC1 bacterium ADurb.BinA364]
MDDPIIRLTCDECRLSWHISLLDQSIGLAIHCPFCGNRHFAAPFERHEHYAGASAAADRLGVPENEHLPAYAERAVLLETIR